MSAMLQFVNLWSFTTGKAEDCNMDNGELHLQVRVYTLLERPVGLSLLYYHSSYHSNITQTLLYYYTNYTQTILYCRSGWFESVVLSRAICSCIPSCHRLLSCPDHNRCFFLANYLNVWCRLNWIIYFQLVFVKKHALLAMLKRWLCK